MTCWTFSATRPNDDANPSHAAGSRRATTVPPGSSSSAILTSIYGSQPPEVSSRRPRVRRAHCYTRPGSTVGRSLVLNATLQPLAVVPARRAVVLVLKEKADIVHSNGIVFRSERVELPAPSVVKLRYFVNVPFRARAALTRRAVFARDGWVCQYCGAAAENVDHVVPKSRGGEHAWENVVAACRRGNSRQESRPPH